MKAKLRVIEGSRKRSIFADLDALRIAPDDDADEVSTCAEAKETQPRNTFAKFPKLWHDRLKAIHASGDLQSFAWVLLYRANLKLRFPVTSTILWEAGVARQHKRALLEQLESAGLVRVEWRPAPQVPWITVLHLIDGHRRRK
jgi:hypothetical protein